MAEEVTPNMGYVVPNRNPEDRAPQLSQMVYAIDRDIYSLFRFFKQITLLDENGEMLLDKNGDPIFTIPWS